MRPIPTLIDCAVCGHPIVGKRFIRDGLAYDEECWNGSEPVEEELLNEEEYGLRHNKYHHRQYRLRHCTHRAVQSSIIPLTTLGLWRIGTLS